MLPKRGVSGRVVDQHEGFFIGYKTIKVSDVCVLGWFLPGCASRSGKCFADDQWGSRLSSLGQRLHLLEKRRGRKSGRGSPEAEGDCWHVTRVASKWPQSWTVSTGLLARDQETQADGEINSKRRSDRTKEEKEVWEQNDDKRQKNKLEEELKVKTEAQCLQALRGKKKHICSSLPNLLKTYQNHVNPPSISELQLHPKPPNTTAIQCGNRRGGGRMTEIQ